MSDTTQSAPAAAAKPAAAATSTAAAKPAKEKAVKAPAVPKEVKPKTYAGFGAAQKITFLKDSEGKLYGSENNPKRKGSKAEKLFLKYTNGMEVGDFIKAGGTASALKYDTSHKFIAIA